MGIGQPVGKLLLFILYDSVIERIVPVGAAGIVNVDHVSQQRPLKRIVEIDRKEKTGKRERILIKDIVRYIKILLREGILEEA